MKTYYLDHAATTPLNPIVLETMIPYMTVHYGNPSSMHQMGIEVKKAINESREKVGSIFQIDPKGVIFTSGGTEATNLAILGYAKAHPERNEIIISSIEHHATLHTCDALRKMGYVIHVVPVNHEGFIDIDGYKNHLNEQTLMVSFIWANNEIGTIQDMKTIGHLAHQVGAYVHVDGVQMVPHHAIDLSQYPIDLLTLSAHKFYGPKGIGALLIKQPKDIEPIVFGGKQELGLRSGTENVYGIIGLAKALELQMKAKDDVGLDVKKNMAMLRDQLQKELPMICFNGPMDETKRLPGLLSLSLPNVASQDLAFALDDLGIFVSTGSACLSNEIVSSHVLKAIGVDDNVGTIRISMGQRLTDQDIKEITLRVKKAYRKLT
jgi:cysteine desulfurase